LLIKLAQVDRRAQTRRPQRKIRALGLDMDGTFLNSRVEERRIKMNPGTIRIRR
jgi:hypothetical protein